MKINMILGPKKLPVLLFQCLIFFSIPFLLSGHSFAEGPADSAGKKFVVYYFHGNYRCPTCLKLEKLSREAVKENFKKELTSGLVEYKAVNVDTPENRHFVNDFGLFTKSLVVVEEDGGKVKRYKNLQKIWELVRDEVAFNSYVKDEVKGFIKGVTGKKAAIPAPSTE